jgi:hypothetical protein
MCNELSHATTRCIQDLKTNRALEIESHNVREITENELQIQNGTKVCIILTISWNDSQCIDCDDYLFLSVRTAELMLFIGRWYI